jgi:hypothetical protein
MSRLVTAVPDAAGGAPRIVAGLEQQIGELVHRVVPGIVLGTLFVQHPGDTVAHCSLPGWPEKRRSIGGADWDIRRESH